MGQRAWGKGLKIMDSGKSIAEFGLRRAQPSRMGISENACYALRVSGCAARGASLGEGIVECINFGLPLTSDL